MSDYMESLHIVSYLREGINEQIKQETNGSE